MTQELARRPPEAARGGGSLPLYVQVAATLRTAILRGLYPIGARMPTEEALCERFKVSRHTIREALRQLRIEGLIASRPGSRPIVASAAPRRTEVIAGDIGKDFFDYTIATRFEIARMETMSVTPSLAEKTGLAAGEEWLCAEGYRINIDDGRPTCWNEYYIHRDYALVGRILARHVGPFIPLLEDLFEIRIARITRAISAVRMPAARAGQLGAEPRSAALHVVVRCETPDGALAMLHRSVHPRGTVTYAIKR